MDIPPPVSSVVAPAPLYHDRRGGLIAFGVIEILLGTMALLALPMMLLGQFIGARRGQPPMDTAVLVAAILGVLMAATGGIWLGIGSIQCRRWARALILCLAWISLVSGTISLISMLIHAGAMKEAFQLQSRQELPALAATFILVGTIVMSAFMNIAVPGIAVLFYRSPHVRRTCEARDPQPRWTDRCPLPVLAVCLMQAMGALYLLAMPSLGYAIPFAGGLITGAPARLIWCAVIVLLLYSMRGFYRLDRTAWTVYLIATFVLSAGAIATFVRIDLLDYYRAIGLSDSQLALMAQNPFSRATQSPWIYLSYLAITFGYLLYVRRYFTRQPGRDDAHA